MPKKCAKCGMDEKDAPEYCWITPGGTLQWHVWPDQEPPKAEDPASRQSAYELNKDIENQKFEQKADPRPWMDQLYDLYEQGRKKGVPVGFIDYFQARELMQKTLSESLRRATEKVKGLKKSFDIKADYNPDDLHYRSYNQALAEAAESITSDSDRKI